MENNLEANTKDQLEKKFEDAFASKKIHLKYKSCGDVVMLNEALGTLQQTNISKLNWMKPINNVLMNKEINM